MKLVSAAEAHLASKLGISSDYRADILSLARRCAVATGCTDGKLPSADQITQWLQRRLDAAEISPATANKHVRMLSAVYRSAGEAIRLPKAIEPDTMPVAWTLEEIRRLSAAASNVPGRWLYGVPASLAWPMGISILWDTAARVGELCKALVSDVDLDRRLWLVPAANRKGRRRWKSYRLHPETVGLIRRRLESGGEKLWPFPGHRRQLWQHLKRLLQSAGLPDDRHHMFHCIRRTAESMAAAERGVEWAAACVGHGAEVARRHYISPSICPGPALWEALPRPTDGQAADRQLRLFDLD